MKNLVERLPDGLRITRTFDAPRALVFEAFTLPEHTQAWWGCANSKCIESTVDLRVGGEFRHKLDIEDCGIVDMVSTFTIVDIPSQLAWTQPGSQGMPTSHTSVLFEDLGAQTRVQLTVSGLESDEIQGIVTTGWSGSFEKLATQIETARENQA